MDVNTKQRGIFFQQNFINTLFHFPTRKIGNFLTFPHPTPILVSSATWVITPTTSVNHQRLLGIPEDPPKKKLTLLIWSILLLLYATFSAHELFSQSDILFLKKTYHEVHTKRTEQDTLPFFINLLLLVFSLYMYVFFIVCILLFCVMTLVALFFYFPSLTILCIEYQVHHTWNSGANLCREEKNLVFCFGAQFNSTLNFTQSGWHILFSPDLHFRLAKRVSGQTHPLQLETATRTDVPLVVPA